MPPPLKRRQFLRDSGLLLAGAPLSRALRAQTTDDYRALVCVFLFGGLDCHDVLIPIDSNGWNEYRRLREPLLNQYGNQRQQSSLLSLVPLINDGDSGQQLALPPELGGLKSLFDKGELSWIGNVGPLVSATNRASLDARSVPLPPRLFSHNDQQSVWQASAPEGAQYGWGSHHLVMGGAVQGGQILWTVPPPVLGHDQDAGGGRLIPTIAVDQYAAALGQWLGLSPAAVGDALPNLANFSAQPLAHLFKRRARSNGRHQSTRIRNCHSVDTDTCTTKPLVAAAKLKTRWRTSNRYP